MTQPQHNATDRGSGTPLLNGHPWKSTHDWVSALPPLLNGRGAEDKVAQRVLLNLSSKADHRTGRNAYPSNAWLAERCHVSERSVRSALQRLEEAKRIERDGLSRHGTVRWRMRFEYDVPAGWLPLDAREERKRELAAERQRRRRAKLISEAKCVTEQPGTSSEQASTPEAECVTEPVDLGSQVRDVTQLASDDLAFQPPVKETTQLITDVAAAPPAGLDVIEAELVSEPGTELATVQPPMIPNLSAAWLLPDTTAKRAPAAAPLYDAREWPEPSVQHTLTEWVKLLTDRWSAACIEVHRSNPSGPMFGQAGKNIRALIHAGNNPNHVAMAVSEAGAKGSAAIGKFMPSVRPSASWQNARTGGRQVLLPSGPVQLPAGATASHARQVTIAALFPTS